MKKIVLPFTLLIIIAGACEQKFETWQVPKEVLHTFKQQYPSADADWEIEDSEYEATLKTGGDKITMLYNKNGDLLQSEKAVKASELPTEMKNYFSANYNGRKISNVKKIIKKDGEINYEVRADETTLVFSKDGEFIKKENQ